MIADVGGSYWLRGGSHQEPEMQGGGRQAPRCYCDLARILVCGPVVAPAVPVAG